MRSPASLALALAAFTLAIGFLGGRLSAPDAAPSGGGDPAPRSRAEEPEEPSGAELSSPSFRSPSDEGAGPGERVDAGGGREPSDDAEAMFSEPLLQHAREGILEGWSSERRDEPGEEVVAEGLATFREQTLAMPPVIGVQLARRRTAAELAAEDARTGGAFAVLDQLMEGGAGPLPKIVESKATFDGFFRTESQGPTLGPAALSGDGRPEDGTTVTFPAGVFEVDDFGRLWGEDYPADLTLRGAGKDATMLVLRSDWSARGRIRNLTIEGLTIHANNNYMFDLRMRSMSLTIRRCRLTGWTTGAGASCLFGTEGLVLRVEDTEITGAYCRRPAYGRMFDVRHAGLLARFENCTIEAMKPFESFNSGGTAAFVNCTIRSAVGRGREVPAGVSLPGTNVEWFEGEDPNALARDLDDLFPDWESRMQR